jgi:hypothetical protein
MCALNPRKIARYTGHEAGIPLAEILFCSHNRSAKIYHVAVEHE